MSDEKLQFKLRDITPADERRFAEAVTNALVSNSEGFSRAVSAAALAGSAISRLTVDPAHLTALAEAARSAMANTDFRFIAAVASFQRELQRQAEEIDAALAAVRAGYLRTIENMPRNLSAFNYSAFSYGDGCSAGRAIRATLDTVEEVPGVM